MNKLPVVNFGIQLYREHEGSSTYTTSYSGISAGDFSSYISEFPKGGFTFVERHNFGENEFYTYAEGADAVFVSYYPAIKEMRIVEEPDSNYLNFTDRKGTGKVQPQITHVDLEPEAYGLSYVVRLHDGRFLVFDGAWDFEPVADHLVKCLKEESPYEKPCIAAWIMTHPHCDHYRVFLPFYEKYADAVVIERFLFNFPELSAETEEKIPYLYTSRENEKLKIFYDYVKRTAAPVYRAHTGQVYQIGEARLEVLSSMDDTFFAPVTDINPFSLVIKMMIEGQSILWCADTYFKEARLGERYGTYLKSDICQIPHHGFCGGEKAEYALIRPSVCLAPISESDGLAFIDIHYDFNQYLLYELGVEEFLAGGSGNFSLPLPYYPRSKGREQLLQKIGEMQRSTGAKYWFFMDLTPDVSDFSIVNVTYKPAEIYVNLLFDNGKHLVRSIRITVPGQSVVRKNITDPEQIEADALHYNPFSLAKQGIPEGAKFTAHFRSNVPVVIKGTRAADYYAD